MNRYMTQKRHPADEYRVLAGGTGVSLVVPDCKRAGRPFPLICLVGILFVAAAQAATIDPNKPLPESLKPDLLYFDFDMEDSGQQVSKTKDEFLASVETGKAGTPPESRPGRNPAFGKALEFNYGNHPPFDGDNNEVMGNHLKVPDAPSLRLTGQSFTMGAWIQIPENAELPPSPYKKFLVKGGFSAEYPGWTFQISRKNETWHARLTLVGADGKMNFALAKLPRLEPGAWHHLAASFDAETKMTVIWFDGTRVFAKEVPAEVGESDRPLIVGENGMSTYGNIPLVLDDVFIVSEVHDFSPVEP